MFTLYSIQATLHKPAITYVCILLAARIRRGKLDKPPDFKKRRTQSTLILYDKVACNAI